MDSNRPLAGYVRLVVLALLLVLSFFIARPFVLTILTAAVVAYAAYPFYGILLKGIRFPKLAAIVACVIVFLIVVIPTFFFVQALVQESFTLYQQGKQAVATELFEECERDICFKIVDWLGDPQLAVPLHNAFAAVTNYLVDKGSELLVSIPGMVLNLFVFFFALFYLLIDGPAVVDYLQRLAVIDPVHRERVVARIKGILHAVVYGHLLIALLQGIIGGVGFYLFGLPSPIFWGFVIMVLAFLPLLGTGLVWGPAAVILFLQGLFTSSNLLMLKGVGLFFYGLLLISSVDNILKPRLIGRISGVHPVVIVVGIFGGLALMGMVGIILGPVVLAVTLTTLDAYLARG